MHLSRDLNGDLHNDLDLDLAEAISYGVSISTISSDAHLLWIWRKMNIVADCNDMHTRLVKVTTRVRLDCGLVRVVAI
jgi:hypothetical protein